MTNTRPAAGESAPPWFTRWLVDVAAGFTIVMPGNTLSAEQVDQVVDYIEALRNEEVINTPRGI